MLFHIIFIKFLNPHLKEIIFKFMQMKECWILATSRQFQE